LPISSPLADLLPIVSLIFVAAMTTVDTSPSAAPPETVDEYKLRRQARRRAWFCPGAGWALLGHPGRAGLTFFSYAALLVSALWLIWRLSAVALGLTAAFFLATLVIWSIEIARLGRAEVRPAPAAWLVRWCWPITTLVLLASVAVPLLVLLELDVTRVNGDAMLPSIAPFEPLVYHRRPNRDDLAPGSIVLCKLSDDTRVGRPGMLLIGRVLALPGQKLSIRKGAYAVDGEKTDYLADVHLDRPAVDVPKWPKEVTVPDERYFVVQDSPRPGLDSRSFSWVRWQDMEGTRIHYLRPDRLLQPVE
jgi:signal peptidase I